jgi:peptidoglycan DL-endopeptidase CwlO
MKKHVCKVLLLSATLTACMLASARATTAPKLTPKPQPSVGIRAVTRTTSPTSRPSTSATSAPTPSPTAMPIPSPTPAPRPVPPITQFAYRAMKFMRANIGKTYALGGTGPDAYDCSGLIQAAWKAVGITLPRTSGQQYDATVRISYADLQPGDLVFFGYHGSHHVGMYIGNNQMIDAANPRRDVTFSDLTLSWYKQNLGGYGRIPATDL